MRWLLDTTVLIDVLRGDEAALAWIGTLDQQPACSEISRVEIWRGLRSGERSDVERLFAGIDWVPLSEPVARRAGELGRTARRSHSAIGVADLVVAASAIEREASLATANIKHYPMFKGLRPPY